MEVIICIFTSVCMHICASSFKTHLGLWGNKRMNVKLWKFFSGNLGRNLSRDKGYKCRVCEHGIKEERKIGGTQFFCHFTLLLTNRCLA